MIKETLPPPDPDLSDYYGGEFKMKKYWKSIVAIVGGIATIFGAVWAFDAHYVPREVHDIQLTGLTETIQNMRKSSQIDLWRNWYFYWNAVVEELVLKCAKNPSDECRRQLDKAREKQAEARRKLEQLQRE